MSVFEAYLVNKRGSMQVFVNGVFDLIVFIGVICLLKKFKYISTLCCTHFS